VVDVNGIDELRHLTVDGRGGARIGSLVRHEQLVRSDDLRQHWPLLAAACRHMSNPVVRRRGTVGGSVAWRDGRSEVAAALLACDAGVVVRSTGARCRSAMCSSGAPRGCIRMS
jgi:carbon-monoxide dehydrogenase medium subunit